MPSQIRAAVAGLGVIALMLGASNTEAQSGPTTPRPDYGKPEAWLCRPDRLGACQADATATVISPDGSASVERVVMDPEAPVDCFYVYPTVSTDSTDLSDLEADAAERNVIRLQLIRFGSKCRLYAPIYRQVTLAGLRRALAGGALPDRFGAGYQDVREAWRHYLEHDNAGRGVVLIGHSQGAAVLTELIRNEIEGTPVADRIVSALLIGRSGGILVPRGQDVGGTFRQFRLCRSESQFGCVVSYSSFRESAPPPPNALFARSNDSTLVVACTNPAALQGEEAELSSYFDAEGGAAISSGPTTRWTHQGQLLVTPLVRVKGLVSGRCVSDGNSHYLAITVHRGANTSASRDIQGDLSARWGLHLVDMELAMGNLVDLVGRQAKTFLNDRSRR